MPRLLLLLLALGLFFAACSDTEPAASTTVAAPVTAPDSPSPPADTPDGVTATVVDTIDGDSLLVSLDGAETEVRLLGVNAPEGTECYGPEATEAHTVLVASGTVVLVQDGDTDRDRFDRLLRYVYADGANVNEALVAGGFAVANAADHGLRDLLRETGDRAWQERTGMWFPVACGEPPAADVRIRDLEFNPPGDDGDDLNGEWVEVESFDTGDVDLTDWGIRDDSSSNRYVFPDGFVAGPGVVIRVHSGCGTDSTTELFWCADQPVWNNAGDTVIVQDGLGNVAARVAYG
jgi:micrococcal nuclease